MYKFEDETVELTETVVDHWDNAAKKEHYDRVWDAGCFHEAMVENGQTLLVSCERCQPSS